MERASTRAPSGADGQWGSVARRANSRSCPSVLSCPGSFQEGKYTELMGIDGGAMARLMETVAGAEDTSCDNTVHEELKQVRKLLEVIHEVHRRKITSRWLPGGYHSRIRRESSRGEVLETAAIISCDISSNRDLRAGTGSLLRDLSIGSCDFASPSEA